MRPFFSFLILATTALLCACGCTEREVPRATVELTLEAPPELPAVDFTALEVKVQHVDEPLWYTGTPQADGTLRLEVTPGRYTLLVNATFPDGFSVSAATDVFLALPWAPSTFHLKLDVALSSGLIIKQVYYAGSKTPQGANYTKDQFIEIYNNSNNLQYLDSLCIGAMAPANSTSQNNPWAGEDLLGLFQMAWMIPGNGTNYPLAPGQSVVLALNAVDHTPRCTSGLDLSKAHFGFYDEALSGHEIHPNVIPLKRIFAGRGTAYTLSVNSPAPVIFRPLIGVQKWLDKVDTYQKYEPGSSSGLIYMHIERLWILDGVECAQSPSRALKRLPTAVDASYTYLREGQNNATAVVRKVKEVLPEGRIIYQDTNNSAEDFLTDVPAQPVLTPLWP